MSTPLTHRQRGGVLLGLIVLAALLLIGAASFGVLRVRQLNQQRQVQTQAYLEQAFHGLFPGNRRNVANMHADFGYTPSSAGAPYDLRALVDRARVTDSDSAHGSVPAYTGTQTTTTFNYWNGPYWTGPVDPSNYPLDAWGRRLQLRYISTTTPPGWQVFSLGINGVSETGDSGTPGGDDQVYPPAPYAVASTTVSVTGVSLSIDVSALGPGNNHWVDVYISDSTGTVHLSPFNKQMHSNGSGGKPSSFSFSYASPIMVLTPPGTVTITVTDGGVTVYSQTISLSTSTTMPIPVPVT